MSNAIGRQAAVENHYSPCTRTWGLALRIPLGKYILSEITGHALNYQDGAIFYLSCVWFRPSAILAS